MSSISVNTITDASGGATTTVNGFTPTVSNMAGRNRIINGDMRIDQRNAGASVTAAAGSTYGIDRWVSAATQASKFTMQRSTDAPSGFNNSLLVTSSSAYSVTGNDYFSVHQVIEGYNVSDLNYGTASAQTITFSFWVKSSLTGSFGGSIENGAQNRCYSFAYTVSSANTWEYKTVTAVGDTTGTWNTDNTGGMIAWFGLGASGTRVGTAGAWGTQSGSGLQPTGTVSVVGTSGATFYITGVQLEEGSVATPFEHRQYGQELALCQRYFQNAKYGINAVAFGVSNTYSGGDRVFLCGGSEFKVDMRAQPTITLYSAQTRTLGQVSGYSSGTNYVVSSIQSPDNRRIGLYLQLASSPPVFDTLSFYFDASAEL